MVSRFFRRDSEESAAATSSRGSSAVAAPAQQAERVECPHCGGTGCETAVDELPWASWMSEPPQVGSLVVARWPRENSGKALSYCMGRVDEFGLVDGRSPANLTHGTKHTEWLPLESALRRHAAGTMRWGG